MMSNLSKMAVCGIMVGVSRQIRKQLFDCTTNLIYSKSGSALHSCFSGFGDFGNGQQSGPFLFTGYGVAKMYENLTPAERQLKAEIDTLNEQANSLEAELLKAWNAGKMQQALNCAIMGERLAEIAYQKACQLSTMIKGRVI